MEIFIAIIVMSVAAVILMNKMKPNWMTKMKTMITKKMK